MSIGKETTEAMIQELADENDFEPGVTCEIITRGIQEWVIVIGSDFFWCPERGMVPSGSLLGDSAVESLTPLPDGPPNELDLRLLRPALWRKTATLDNHDELQ